MKKALLLAGLAVSLFSFTGCASLENQVAKDGGLFVSTRGDYIVINSSGDRIMDVWKLKDAFVDSEASSDGWSFIDNNNNVIMLGGDVKVIRVKDNKTWNKYEEYHYDEIFMQELINE